MEWEIQLKTKGLNQWILDVQQKLTLVRDLLDVLETEEAQLKKAWRSSAMEMWEKEFEVLLVKARRQLKEMQKLVLLLDESACALARTEKGMERSAEGI